MVCVVLKYINVRLCFACFVKHPIFVHLSALCLYGLCVLNAFLMDIGCCLCRGICVCATVVVRVAILCVSCVAAMQLVLRTLC